MNRIAALLLVCLSLAACSGGSGGTPLGIHAETSGGSQEDAFVAMASTTTPGNPVGADWPQAASEAARRCRRWGYDDAGSYSGWREVCRAWDRYGRCIATLTTRFYPCTG